MWPAALTLDCLCGWLYPSLPCSVLSYDEDSSRYRFANKHFPYFMTNTYSSFKAPLTYLFLLESSLRNEASFLHAPTAWCFFLHSFIHSFIHWVKRNDHVRHRAELPLLIRPVVSVSVPWTEAHQASLSLTVSQSLPKFMFITSVMPSSHLILWCPLLLLHLIFPSIRVFSNELSVLSSRSLKGNN